MEDRESSLITISTRISHFVLTGLPEYEKLRLRSRVAAAEMEPGDGVQSTSSGSDGVRQTVTRSVIRAVLFASLGAFLFGYHLGVVNGPLDAIASDLGFTNDTFLQGSVVSSLLAGAAVGSLTGGSLADTFGRRRILVFDSGVMLLGALLAYLASNLTVLLTARLLTGLTIGLSSAIVPLYISEVSPTSIRGALGSLNQLAICIGILGALCVNVIIPSSSWRVMFLLSAVPAVLLGVGMSLCEESPRWLVSKGHHSAAKEVMVSLWDRVDESLEKLVTNHEEHGSSTVSISKKNSILSERNLSIVFISCSLFLFQQFSGINAIVYFSTKVFAEAGTSNMTLASAAVGATNVLGTVFAFFLMDQSGRKQLLSLSFLGMGISMAIMVLGFSMESLSGVSGTIALLGTLAYILFFGLGVGPVPGLLVPEIASAEVRGQMMSFAFTTHWVTNFLIGQLFLPAIAQFGISRVYCFFSLVCFCAIVFVKQYIVETKGRSLEEIEKAMFN
eukprot:g6393.t1